LFDKLDHAVSVNLKDKNHIPRVRGPPHKSESLPLIKNNNGVRALIPISMVNSEWIKEHEQYRSAKYVSQLDANEGAQLDKDMQIDENPRENEELDRSNNNEDDAFLQNIDPALRYL
jgi:hypothetical protein